MRRDLAEDRALSSTKVPGKMEKKKKKKRNQQKKLTEKEWVKR